MTETLPQKTGVMIMIYEGQICRAPMERASFMLPVMVGCSYGRCKFCNLFRHLAYRELPLSQVEDELRRVRDMNGRPRRIFLGDGNAFGLDAGHLEKVLDMIRGYFPQCEAVNMDATVTSILMKSDEELAMLFQKGVRHLYIGIESGLDDVLAFMEKDHDMSQAYEAVNKIRLAGMIFDAHIMTGVAGAGRGAENAEALAAFLNSTSPRHVVNFSMFHHKEVPLYQHILDNTFRPADELENLREERRLLELLGTPDVQEGEPVIYDGFHDYIQFRVRGRLPVDRTQMLDKLKEAIRQYEHRSPVFSYVQGECPHLEKCDGLQKVWNMQT